MYHIIYFPISNNVFHQQFRRLSKASRKQSRPISACLRAAAFAYRQALNHDGAGRASFRFDNVHRPKLIERALPCDITPFSLVNL